MKEFKRLMPYHDALNMVLKDAITVKSESVLIKESRKRVLSASVDSTMDSPPFDRAAMDGYALKASDTFSVAEGVSVHLRLKGDIVAGDASTIELLPNEAVAITTGAPIPKGADAVVMQEYASCNGDEIEVYIRSFPGQHISRKGEDVSCGQQVLASGTCMGPQHIALAASLGIEKVDVYKKIRVGIIVTGSELKGADEKADAVTIYDSNTPMLSALADSSLCKVSFSERVPDNEAAICGALEKARSICDMILITGGSSFGSKDVVSQVVGDFKVHGVGIKPGKPFGFVAGDKPIFVLSGYPVAAFFQYYLFVVPYIEKVYDTKILRRSMLQISDDVASSLGRCEVIKCSLEGNMLLPLKMSGSSLTSSLTYADGFTVVESETEGLNRGDMCEFIFFL